MSLRTALQRLVGLASWSSSKHMLTRTVDTASAIQQFNKLVETLAARGLTTEVRNGDDQSVLIFVKLSSDKHLYSEIYRSRFVMCSIYECVPLTQYIGLETGSMACVLQHPNKRLSEPSTRSRFIQQKDSALSTR